MFGKNGTALSQADRAQIAKRRGLCLKCGTRTHEVKTFGRKALTNDDVYQGICIKDNPGVVPPQVYKDWQGRNQLAPVQRFKRAVNAARFVHRPREPLPLPSSPPPHARQSVAVPPSGPGLSNVPQRSARNEHLRRAASQPESHVGMDISARSIGTSNHSAGAAKSLHASFHQTSSTALEGSRNPSGRQGSNSSMSTMTSAASEMGDFRGPAGMHAVRILEDLKFLKDKPDMAMQSLHAIRNVCPVEGDIIREIKSIMDLYRGDPKYMMLSAGALWGSASTSDEKKAEAISVGCLDMLLEMLQTGATRANPETSQWALGALSSLGRFSANRNVILQQHGVETILENMKHHEKEACVFEWGCRALFSLIGGFDAATNAPGTFEGGISAIEKYGGVRVIVGCIKMHADESVTVWWAVNLLLSMLEGRTTKPGLAGLVQLMNDDDLGTITVRLLKGTLLPEYSIRLQEMVICLISQAQNQLLQHSAVECIPPIIERLISHPQNEHLYEASARFLISVGRQNLEAKRRISGGPGIHVLLSSMTRFPTNLKLHRGFMNLFWLLSGDSSSFDYSVVGEARQAIESAFASYPADTELSEAVCGFVANVACKCQNQPDSLPKEVVIKIAASGNAARQGSRALAALVSSFPEVATTVVEGHMLSDLIASMCDSLLEVQTTGTAALSSIVSISETARKKFLDAGGLTTASAALLTTPSEPFAANLMLLIKSSLISSVVDISAVPQEIVAAVHHAVVTFPNQTKVGFSIIRNLVAATSASLNVDSGSTTGLLDIVLRVLEAPNSPDELAIDASGALWALGMLDSITDPSILERAYVSTLGLCARHRGEESPYNAIILLEASGALAAVMQCVTNRPIPISGPDVDLIIGILDIVIDRDIDNVALMANLMDIILALCGIAKDVVLEFGVIVVIIDCMADHEGNEIIQEKGCAILALLASSEDLQINLGIAETDGIDMVISALAGFTENPSLQTEACRALSYLSIDKESRMLISSQGGLILLANAMSKFHFKADLVEAAASALLNLSSDVEEQVLLSSNIAETVVATMKLQPDSLGVQEKCLGILQNVSMRSKDAKSSVAQAGGIGAIIGTIHEFIGTSFILERAFTTLWSLSVLERNQELIADENGIVCVINGMLACVNSERVQKQGCGCLCTLSSNSGNKTVIRDSGGVDAIVYAMWAHYTSDALLIEACRALSSLAVNVQTNEVMIVTEGETSAMLSAMRRFPQSERLQEYSCLALRNLLLSADNVAILRPQATEVIELVTAASSRFPAKCSERVTQILKSLG